MKRILALSFSCCLMLLAISCDKIEGPYIVTDTDEEITVQFPDLDLSTVYRKVLIEEYTGHRCPNCPTGHEKLDELLARFGDTLIPICIHATSLAQPTTEFPDNLMTEVGTQLANDYQIDGIPAAIINRANEPMGSIPARWLSKVQAVDRSHTPAAIQIINQYGETGEDVLKVNVKVTLIEEQTNPLRIALFIVEDGIVSPQIDGTDIINDYVHNHVLRGSLNDTYGTLLDNASTAAGLTTFTMAKSFSLACTNWNPAHCSVVAILYDKNNYDVLQVEKKYIY